MDTRVKKPIPDEVIRRLAEQAGTDASPRMAEVSDLDLERRFGRSWLAVFDGKVAVCDDAGRGFALALADIETVRLDELFGSGRLVAETDDGERTLVYYTKNCVNEFASFARALDDLAHGKEAEAPEQAERALCEKCGFPLPERGERCPVCVPRWAVFQRLLGLVKPHRRKAWLLLAATFVTVSTQLIPPMITKMIVDDVIKPKDLSRLWVWIAGMAACGVTLLVSRLVSGSLSTWLAARVVLAAFSLTPKAPTGLSLNPQLGPDAKNVLYLEVPKPYRNRIKPNAYT